MGVRLRELRERCQLPVREHNDVAGLLFGDFASLPLTKLFVDFGWSPNVATLGMLVCGLAGAALQLLPGPWPLVGALLLLLYYVLDGDVPGNTKIANRPAVTDDGKTISLTLVETRGEGGYVIVAPTGGQCHPSGRFRVRETGGRFPGRGRQPVPPQGSDLAGGWLVRRVLTRVGHRHPVLVVAK